VKVRTGFVSNSSASSFVVQTKKEEYDILQIKDFKELPAEKIELLKNSGFVPIKDRNPFNMSCFGQLKANTDDDTFLGYSIVCQQDEVMQFLVANNIPFRASIHYNDYLYSYDMDDDFICVLHNYGLSHWQFPKEVFNEEENWVENEPFRKINKADFLRDYDEESSLKTMGDDFEN
jgi:hypothetical protein